MGQTIVQFLLQFYHISLILADMSPRQLIFQKNRKSLGRGFHADAFEGERLLNSRPFAYQANAPKRPKHTKYVSFVITTELPRQFKDRQFGSIYISCHMPLTKDCLIHSLLAIIRCLRKTNWINLFKSSYVVY